MADEQDNAYDADHYFARRKRLRAKHSDQCLPRRQSRPWQYKLCALSEIKAFSRGPVFFEMESKRTAIINSTRKTRPAIADGRSDKLSFMGPAALAIGGTLSLVWASALGLCGYNLVCWLLA